MKKSTKKKLSIIVSVSLILAPIKIKGIEYKTLPIEAIKIESQELIRKRK